MLWKAFAFFSINIHFYVARVCFEVHPLQRSVLLHCTEVRARNTTRRVPWTYTLDTTLRVRYVSVTERDYRRWTRLVFYD